MIIRFKAYLKAKSHFAYCITQYDSLSPDWSRLRQANNKTNRLCSNSYNQVISMQLITINLVNYDYSLFRSSIRSSSYSSAVKSVFYPVF